MWPRRLVYFCLGAALAVVVAWQCKEHFAVKISRPSERASIPGQVQGAPNSEKERLSEPLRRAFSTPPTSLEELAKLEEDFRKLYHDNKAAAVDLVDELPFDKRLSMVLSQCNDPEETRRLPLASICVGKGMLDLADARITEDQRFDLANALNREDPSLHLRRIAATSSPELILAATAIPKSAAPALQEKLAFAYLRLFCSTSNTTELPLRLKAQLRFLPDKNLQSVADQIAKLPDGKGRETALATLQMLSAH